PAEHRRHRRPARARAAPPRRGPVRVRRHDPEGEPVQLTESRRTVLAVVGNPRPASRTRTVAEAVAQLIADAVEGDGPPVAVEVMEVAELGPHLLGWGDPVAAEALDRLLSADALVIASPVFKATYTGLLKL